MSRREWALTAAASVGALLGLTMVWLVPRELGDYFVGLAAGRDIVKGLIGKPDEWSFTTTGRVWLNQNWGTHLIHYLVYTWTGPVGILVLKAFLLLGTAACVALACRERRVSWSLAVFMGGAALAAGRSYIDLRPNLSTLLLAPLLLLFLYRTRRGLYWMWAAVVVAGIWANMHGGFIFGLGMMGCWTVCRLLTAAWRIGPAKAMRENWPLPVGTLAAVALAMWANPYGPINLIHPFTMTDPGWRQVEEWKPLLARDPIAFGTSWEFLTVIGIFVTVLAIRLVATAVRSGFHRPRNLPVDTFLFDTVLVVVLVTMTFMSRRFVPLTIILISPVLALHLEWLLQPRRLLWPLASTVGLLLIPVLLSGYRLARSYDRDNPLRPPESMHDRMMGCESLLRPVTDFLNANRISGRAVNDWRYEGYLRWRSPQIKLFMGGRAQTVYDQETHRLFQRIVGGQEPTTRLSALDIHLIILPLQDWYTRFLNMTLANRWSFVYDDGDMFVLADAGYPPTRSLIDQAAAGTLAYPHPAIAALSRARCLASPGSGAGDPEIKAALEAAIDLKPVPDAYRTLVTFFDRSQLAPAKAAGYLGGQYDRLAALPVAAPDGLKILIARLDLAQVLIQLSRRMGSRGAAARWSEEYASLDRQGRALVNQWQ